MGIVFFICILAKLWFARMDWMSDFHVGHALLELSPLVAAYAAFMLFPWPARFRLTVMMLANATVTLALVLTSLYVHGHGDLPNTSGMRVLASVGEVAGAFANGFNFVYLLYFFDVPLFLLFVAMGRPLEVPWVKVSAKSWMSVFMIATLLFGGLVWMQWRDAVRLPMEKAQAHGVLSYGFAEVIHAVYDGQGKAVLPVGFAAAPEGSNVVLIGVHGLRSRDLGRTEAGQVVTPTVNGLRANAMWTRSFDGRTWAEEDRRLAKLDDWRRAGLATVAIEDDLDAYVAVDWAETRWEVGGQRLADRLVTMRKAGTPFLLHLQVDEPTVREADNQVGALLAMLDAYDFAKRTVVIVYGDTEHAPLFVHVPGMPDVELNRAADAGMVLPTVANLVGRKVPRAASGQDLLNP